MNDISIDKIVLDIKGNKIELTLEEVETLKKVLNEVSKDKPTMTITSSWPPNGTSTWIYPTVYPTYRSFEPINVCGTTTISNTN